MFAVSKAKGKHLFPFRTQQLSLSAPMVVRINTLARVGRCRVHCTEDTILVLLENIMPWDFDNCERLVKDVTAKTQSNELRWEEGRDCLIQLGGSKNPGFFLFISFPPTLILRDLSDPCDLVISPAANS